MKSLLPYSWLLCAALLIGCSTTDKRIDQNQARFDSYDVTTQSQIRQGQVTIGFTPEQVRMSLGEPDREATMETESGKQIVWQYFQGRSGVGLSFGLGTTIGRGSSVGTGVGVHSGGSNRDLEKSIVFDRESGNVSKIETYD